MMNKEHKSRFNQLLQKDGTHPSDDERRTLFYILSANTDLYEKVNHIYDFTEHCITPKCLDSEEVDFCSSSRKLIKLAYNLYNSYPADVIDTFYVLDEVNFIIALNAIKIRFNKGDL